MDNRNRQEENIGSFFDSIEKKKEKSAKIRRIIGRIIRLIIPLFVFPIWYVILVVIAPLVPRDTTGYGDLVIVLGFVFLIFFPIYSLIYGIFVARSEKRKYLFAMYNPAVSTIVFYIIKVFDRDMWLYFVMFGGIAFWTLIPVWIYNAWNKQKNSKESSGEGEP